MELIDIGANLNHESFDSDRQAVMSAAKGVGISHFCITGTDIESVESGVQICLTNNDCSLTTGVHPHYAASWSQEVARHYQSLINEHNFIKAIGETGLDTFRDFCPLATQEQAFAEQLELAVETQLPVFMHERDAHDRFEPILKDYRDNFVDGVVHCFTGEKKALFSYLDMGLYIGITGWICDERRGYHLHDLVKNIPSDRLMIETDCPYLMPRNIRPRPKTKRNEPKNLPYVLQMLAQCLGKTEEELAKETTENARRFFRLDR